MHCDTILSKIEQVARKIFLENVESKNLVRYIMFAILSAQQVLLQEAGDRSVINNRSEWLNPAITTLHIPKA